MIELSTNLIENIAADLDKFESMVKTGVIHSGAAAMSNVMYEEVKAKAPTLGKEHYFYGHSQRYLVPPDNLKKSIYQKFAADRSSDYKQTYRISWRKGAARNLDAAPYGWWVEFGSSRAPAHSFMRPAWDAAKKKMMDAGMARMAARVGEMRDAGGGAAI